MHVTADADELLRASLAAIACSSAAYNGVPVTPAELVDDNDPLLVIFFLGQQITALLNLLPQHKARELLEAWGQFASKTVADRQARGGTPLPLAEGEQE